MSVSEFYGATDILVNPQDLQEFAWSAPMRDLAPKVGLSDVGLKKLLKSRGVVPPPQGYWNKLHAGKPVPRCPKVAARRPGETGRARVDGRFAQVLTPAEPLPSSGPFASAVVSEDLDELYKAELKAVGRVGVPRTLDRVHAGLAHLFKQERRRREKIAESGWAWDAPTFDSPLDRRRLRILNAIFIGLSRRGHSADACERDSEIHATAIIGDTRIGLVLYLSGKSRTRGYERIRDTADLRASTPLSLTLDACFDGKATRIWHDDVNGIIETKLTEVVASIIVAGEAAFRRGLKESEERAEQFRRLEEQRRQEAIAARNADRLKQLHESGDLLRQADDLRALIARVRAAVVGGSVKIDRPTLAAWERWVAAEADRLDPVLSRQILNHLSEATADD